jgi:hypothetical protein
MTWSRHSRRTERITRSTKGWRELSIAPPASGQPQTFRVTRQRRLCENAQANGADRRRSPRREGPAPAVGNREPEEQTQGPRALLRCGRGAGAAPLHDECAYAQFVGRQVRFVLARSGGDKARACRQLAISEPMLIRYLRTSRHVHLYGARKKPRKSDDAIPVASWSTPAPATRLLRSARGSSTGTDCYAP